MFDIGLQELIIIFLVALLVFGPERLPELARTLGKWAGEIRKGVQNVKMQMEAELDESKDMPGEGKKVDQIAEGEKKDETPGSEGRKEGG